MGSKFFGLVKREKKKKEVKKEETYDSSLFTNGQGYDPTAKTVDPEATTFAYAAPHGFDPSKIGAPDEKNYVPTEPEEKPEEEKPVEQAEQVAEVKEEEKKEETKTETVEEKREEVKEKFNPFAAAGEVAPEYQNPVYVEDPEEVKAKLEKEDIDVSLKTIFKLLLHSITKPVEKVPRYAKSIDDMKEAGKLLLLSTISMVVIAIIFAFIAGGFVKKYDINTGLYTTSMDFGNMANIKFGDLGLKVLGFSLVLPAIVAIVYYLTSFMRSKGVSIGSYITLSVLALFPMELGMFVLFPIFSILAYYVGFFAFLISLIFSLFSIYNGITRLCEFNNENKMIFYNVFNIGIVIAILLVILVIFFQNDFNSIINIFNEI